MNFDLTPLMQEITAYWQAGGPLLIPLALLGTGIWTVFIYSSASLNRTLRAGQDTLALLSAFPLDLSRLPHTPGRIAEVLNSALSAPPDALRETLERREDALRRALRRNPLILAALTATTPLTGLLGTVTGMISTFDAVAAASGATPGQVASGISQALITTQFGLVLALPGVFGLARLRKRADQVQVCTAACRVRLLVALEAAPERIAA